MRCTPSPGEEWPYLLSF